jgi:hypothetical protein
MRTVGVVERAYSGPFEVSSPYLTVVINYMYRTEQGLDYPFTIIRLAAPNYALQMPLQYVNSEVMKLRFRNRWKLEGYQWAEISIVSLQWRGNFPYLVLRAEPRRALSHLDYHTNNDKSASPTPMSFMF